MSLADRLATMTQDARTRAARGDVRGARAALDPALDMASATLGADHPQVLATTRLLASMHHELGDLPAARRLLEETLEAADRTLGEAHPLLLLLAYDLGTI